MFWTFENERVCVYIYIINARTYIVTRFIKVISYERIYTDFCCASKFICYVTMDGDKRYFFVNILRDDTAYVVYTYICNAFVWIQ